MQEAGDDIAKALVGNPVGRPGRGGQETAADFVFALCAGLEGLETVADTIFDTLVITGFEMQAMVILVAAPVASVERIVTAQTNCAGNDRLLRRMDRTVAVNISRSLYGEWTSRTSTPSSSVPSTPRRMNNCVRISPGSVATVAQKKSTR